MRVHKMVIQLLIACLFSVCWARPVGANEVLEPITRIGWRNAAYGYIEWSPDGQTFGVQTARGIAVFSNEDRHAPPTILEGQAWFFRYSPDGSILAASYGDHITLYDAHNLAVKGKLLHDHRHANTTLGDGPMSYFTFSPDGSRLAVVDGGFIGSRQAGMSVWDINTGEQLYTLDVDSGQMLWANAGRVLVTFQGGWEGDPMLHFWDAETGDSLPVPSGYDLSAGDLSPDGSTLAAATSGGVRLYNVAEGRQIRILPTGDQGYISRVAYSPDGRLLVIQGTQGLVIWPVGGTDPLAAFEESVRYIVFSPDSREMAYEGDGGIHIWNVQMRQKTGFVPDAFHPFYSPDSRILGYMTADATTLKLEDAATHAVIATYEGFSYWIDQVAFTSDLDGIITTESSGLTREWMIHPENNIDLSRPVERVEPLDYPTVVSDDGRISAVLDGRIIRVWNLDANILLGAVESPTDEFISTLAINPSGSILAYTISDTIFLWSVMLNHEIGTLVGHKWQVQEITFSSSGAWLASVGGDNTIRLWDVESQEPISSFRMSEYGIDQLKFSPNDRVLAGFGRNQSTSMIALWDTESLTQIAFLEGEANSVRSAAFSPDGRLLVTGHNDGTAMVWEVNVPESAGN